MVKNTTGGNKHKKHKNKGPVRTESKIILAESTQVYAVVKKMMGGKHVQVVCSDGETRLCIIEGKHYKKVWIRPNDIILCNIETLGLQNKCYMVLKYSIEHISTLRNQGLLNFLDKEQQEVLETNNDDDDDADEDVDIDALPESNNYFDIDNNNEKSSSIAFSDDDSSSEFYDKPNNDPNRFNYNDDDDLLNL